MGKLESSVYCGQPWIFCLHECGFGLGVFIELVGDMHPFGREIHRQHVTRATQLQLAS